MQCNQAVIRKTQGTNHPGGLQRLTIFASIQAVVGADNSYMMHTHPPDANLLLFGSDAASAYKRVTTASCAHVLYVCMYV